MRCTCGVLALSGLVHSFLFYEFIDTQGLRILFGVDKQFSKCGYIKFVFFRLMLNQKCGYIKFVQDWLFVLQLSYNWILHLLSSVYKTLCDLGYTFICMKADYDLIVLLRKCLCNI